MKNPSSLTALVLGGGGSRGAIEVGLYRALVELGIGIDLIVSSSIGAVNGALIAAGLSPAELEDSWKALRTRDVVGSRWRYLRLLTGASSVFGNHPLRRLLHRWLPVRSFRELRIPLVIVGTDLETAETAVLTKGDLIDAILASTALPGLFPPVRWRGRRLVDGGLSNNMPIDLAVERGAGRVIGMLCHCAKGLPPRANLVSILGQSFSLAINARFRCDMRLYEPQVKLHILEPCIEPNLELLDFDHAWTLIEPAYQYALRELQQQFSKAPEAVAESA
ncbi:patatin-like phospholipase family protein [Acidobacteriia bacterium AH_259_A11_L15]|nr:patatin-like phospholipase family protein [Acidobacteriia bacterium AH_259_A11_L15]